MKLESLSKSNGQSLGCGQEVPPPILYHAATIFTLPSAFLPPHPDELPPILVSVIPGSSAMESSSRAEPKDHALRISFKSRVKRFPGTVVYRTGITGRAFYSAKLCYISIQRSDTEYKRELVNISHGERTS